MEDITAIKKEITYPLSVKKLKKLISGSDRQSVIFGSYIFMAQTYPSDVDLIEEVVQCCGRDDVILKMFKIIHRIIKEVQSDSGVFFSEFKAGLDDRYDLDIKDYDFIDEIDYLYDSKYLNKTEYQTINDNYPVRSRENEEIINEILRLRKVLRWSVKEIKQGYKMLIGRKKKTLKDAFDDFTPVKIDILAPVSGKYIEITNFFILAAEKKNGEKDYINFTYDYEGTIREAIRKYSGTYNRTNGPIYEDYLLRLTPLLQDNIGILYQIKAEIEAIILLYENHKSLPYEILKKQIDGFKNRISYSTIDGEDKDYMYVRINEVVSNFKNKKIVLSRLDLILKLLKVVIDEKALDYLESVDMYPPPDDLL
jgi:hypothetical protein